MCPCEILKISAASSRLKTVQWHWHLLCSPCKCDHHGGRHTGKGLGSRKCHKNQIAVGIIPTRHSQREQNPNLCIRAVLISCWRLLDAADTWEQGTTLYLNSVSFNSGVFFSIKGNKMLKASERIKIRFYRNRAFHLPGGSISWAQALPFLKSPGLPNFYCREASPPFNAFLFFI